MADLRAVMEDAFIKWNEETFVLLRIRVIVGFLMILYVIMFTFSGLLYFSMRTSLLSLVDAVSESILAYTLGAMQAAAFRKLAFPIWALALVSFRSSLGSLDKYGTFSELRNVLKLSAVAFLNVKHGSNMLRIPFWLFWSLLLLKCLYRVVALRQASKSLWHARSSEVLQGYMGHDQSNFNPESCNLEIMAGCRYLVYYGSSKKIKGTGETPGVNALRSVVTLEEIWKHFRGDDMRHLSLAFALSLLLRCRLEGAKLHAATISVTQKLICSLIRTGNADEVVFTILQHDLLFLKQYLHTGYPMVFWQGLRSLFFSFILCITKCYVAVWMSAIINKVYTGDVIGDTRKLSSSSDGIDLWINVIAIVLITGMELWEGITYVKSKWAVLLLICNYVNCSTGAMSHFIRTLSRLIYVHSSSGDVEYSGRYDFLQSFTRLKSVDYSVLMRCTRVAQKVSWIKLPPSGEQNVKAAVIQALARSMDLKGNHLQRELPSPNVSGRKEWYWSASLQLPPRCSHVILVWHIATRLCELKLLQDRRIDLSTKLRGDLQTALCLSEYCAYFLVSKPKLLPEHILVTKKVLQDTVERAHEKLGQCDSLQYKYDILVKSIPPRATVSSSCDIRLSGDILEQGAILANELIHNEREEELWEILAEVWADLLVHIAPSANAEAHAKQLEFRGELITVIWALLCHCGIEKSKLWPDDSGAEETIQGHLNRNSCAGACAQQMATPALPAAPSDSQGGGIEEVEDIAGGARAQQMATPTPPAASRNTQSDEIEEIEDIEIITETSPTLSPSP